MAETPYKIRPPLLGGLRWQSSIIFGALLALSLVGAIVAQGITGRLAAGAASSIGLTALMILCGPFFLIWSSFQLYPLLGVILVLICPGLALLNLFRPSFACLVASYFSYVIWLLLAWVAFLATW